MLLISLLTLFCANENPLPAKQPDRKEAMISPSSLIGQVVKKGLNLININTAHLNAQWQATKGDRAETMERILYGDLSGHRNI